MLVRNLKIQIQNIIDKCGQSDGNSKKEITTLNPILCSNNIKRLKNKNMQLYS